MGLKKSILSLAVIGAGLSSFAAPGAVEKGDLAPSLSGKWLNSAPIDLSARKGKVTIVEFWTFGCFNCIHNFAAYNRWHAKFASKGVALIGVHTPETAAERRESAVKKAIERSHIKYPVLLDPDEKNWSRWGVRYWPTIYLVDKKGRIRDVWEGELAYDGKKGESILGDEVEKLLAE